MAKARILVVEDNRIIADDIQNGLNNLGYVISSVASSGEEAVKKIKTDKPDLVLMDIILEGEIDGIEAAGQIRSLFDIPVVFLTAYADKKILERAKVTEPFGYIIKPFEDRELHSGIEIALYKHRVEKKLRESEEWLSTTLESIGDAVIATDTEGNVKFMNPVAQALTGWKEEEVIDKPLKHIFNIINEETGKPADDPVARVLREGAVIGLANHTVLIAKDGKKISIDDSGAPIKGDRGNIIGVVLVFRDITERKKVEKKLKNSLREKEMLLKEIHHRVKNNMQIIFSLLNLQSRHVKDKNVLSILKESQNRVRSMGLIHEKLYQSKDLARIELSDYVRKLVSGLFHSYGVNSNVIRLKMDIGDVFLDVNTAIPCGLIINELVSNSLKHAFPKSKAWIMKAKSRGEIDISLSPDKNNKFTLIVGDNGIGLPKDLDFKSTDSLGLQLVNTLVEQLEGTITLDRKNGTSFTITFTT